jgi:hypothetical protein
MARSRPPVIVLGLLAAGVAIAALCLALNNPDIDNTSRGDNYPCAAPYDTVLNDADNVPGGEPPADSDSIAARCVDAGQARFVRSVAGGLGAVVLAGTAAVLAVRARRSTSRPREGSSGDVPTSA